VQGGRRSYSGQSVTLDEYLTKSREVAGRTCRTTLHAWLTRTIQSDLGPEGVGLQALTPAQGFRSRWLFELDRASLCGLGAVC